MIAWIITIHAVIYPVEYPTVHDCRAALAIYRHDALVSRAVCLPKGIDPKSVSWDKLP